MVSSFTRIAVLAAMIGLATACANVTPVDYAPVGEIPPGPGLLSGDDGEFTLYRR